jgi:adenylate cyclase
VRPLRRVSVRGYDHLQPWLVRRRADAEAPGSGDAGYGDALDDRTEGDPFAATVDGIEDDAWDGSLPGA